MTHHLRTLLAVAIAITLSGCSYLCRYEARGSVREATTGQPIPAVKVELVNAEGDALADATNTNAAGEFELSFKTSPSAAGSRTGWRMILTAQGFASERIEIGTVKEPKNANETVYLIFRASMRNAH